MVSSLKQLAQPEIVGDTQSKRGKVAKRSGQK